MSAHDKSKDLPGVGYARGTFERRLEEVLRRIPEPLRQAHKHSSHHRNEVFSSEICGCFYCKETFKPVEIEEWIDEDETAMCPRCGIDSVIGSAAGYPLTPEFLTEMNRYWFSVRQGL